MADERIGARLDLGDSVAQAAMLADKLTTVRVATLNLAETYDVLDRKTGVYNATIQREQEEMDRLVAEMVEHSRQQRIMTEFVDEANSKINVMPGYVGKASSAMKEWRFEILTGGRALQDWAQGGFGSILNNLEGFFVKSPAVAGAVTAIATAAYVGLPPLVRYFSAITEGSNKLPEASDRLDRFSDAVKRNTDEQEKLAGKTSLTDDELKRYNELTAEGIRLDNEAAAAKKAKADADALGGVHAPGVDETAKTTADLLQRSIGGNQDKLVEEVVAGRTAGNPAIKAAQDELKKLGDQLKYQLDNDPTGGLQEGIITSYFDAKIKAAQERYQEVLAKIRDSSVSDVAAAVLKGDAGALAGVTGAVGPNSRFAGALAAASPDAVRVDLLNREGGANQQVYEKQVAAAKKAETKLINDLNQEGRDNQAFMKKQAEDQAKFDAALPGVLNTQGQQNEAIYRGDVFQDYAAGRNVDLDQEQSEKSGARIAGLVGRGQNPQAAMAAELRRIQAEKKRQGDDAAIEVLAAEFAEYAAKNGTPIDDDQAKRSAREIHEAMGRGVKKGPAGRAALQKIRASLQQSAEGDRFIDLQADVDAATGGAFTPEQSAAAAKQANQLIGAGGMDRGAAVAAAIRSVGTKAQQGQEREALRANFAAVEPGATDQQLDQLVGRAQDLMNLNVPPLEASRLALMEAYRALAQQGQQLEQLGRDFDQLAMGFQSLRQRAGPPHGRYRPMRSRR